MDQQQYYNLEKTAEMLNLSTGDVNRLREQGKIQGFRDGSDWKFRKSDVEKYLTESIKGRSKNVNPLYPDDDLLANSDTNEQAETLLADSGTFASLLDKATDNFDIGTGDHSESTPKEKQEDADVLLGADSQDDINLSGSSGLSLMDSYSDSGLDLGGNSGLSLLDKDSKQSGKSGSSSNLNLTGDSGLSLLGGSSGFDLNDPDDIILGGSSGNLNLSGDSGLSLMKDPTDFGLSDESNSQSSQKPDTNSSDDDESVFELSDDTNTPSATNTPSISLEKDSQKQDTNSSDDDESVFELSDDTNTPSATNTPSISLEKDSQKQDVFKLAGEDEHDEDAATVLADKPDSSPTASNSDDDLFKLVDDESHIASGPATDGKEDFQLTPSSDSTDDSDSESASQLISIDDEDSFFTSENDKGPGDDGNPFDMASENPNNLSGINNPFDSQPGDMPVNLEKTDLPDGSVASDMSSFGDPGKFSTNDLASPFVSMPGPSGGFTKFPSTEVNYSGMDILLLLVPSLVILIPATIGAYELLRVIWSWSQPTMLGGSLLDIIGGLFKII